MRRIILCLILGLCCFQPALAHEELTTGYITIYDQAGQILYETGRKVYVGDEFISEDDKLYEIIAVTDNWAQAILKSSYNHAPELAAPAAATVAQAAPQAPLIAIYHTHTDESYIPTDGKASTPGRGGIIKVGQVFADKLAALGYRTVHSKTLHEPHDANAYQRSRRTFVKLLTQQPTALFDLHRDSAPLRWYVTRIRGQDVAKLVLVVGRQNQNRRATEAYARQIKAAADRKYKGLIRGIYLARGNYNQDISPRAMLIEVGTEYNSRQAAEKSISYFAEVVPQFIKLPAAQAAPVPAAEPPATGGEPPANQSRAAAPTPEQPTAELPAAPTTTDYSADILSILGVTAAGVAVYFFIGADKVKHGLGRLRTSTSSNPLTKLLRRRRK